MLQNQQCILRITVVEAGEESRGGDGHGRRVFLTKAAASCRAHTDNRSYCTDSVHRMVRLEQPRLRYPTHSNAHIAMFVARYSTR